MANAPGAQQNPIYCMLANGLNVSFDGGATWVAAVSLAEIPLATPSANGLMSAAQAAFLSAQQPGAMVPAVLGPSPEVDFTATVAGLSLFPRIATAGLMFVPWLSRWCITAVAGALTTQPTLQEGYNSAITNTAGSGSLSFATPFAVGVGACTSSTVPANNAALTDASLQDIELTITIAAAGAGLTLKARQFIIGFYTTLIH